MISLSGHTRTRRHHNAERPRRAQSPAPVLAAPEATIHAFLKRADPQWVKRLTSPDSPAQRIRWGARFIRKGIAPGIVLGLFLMATDPTSAQQDVRWAVVRARRP